MGVRLEGSTQQTYRILKPSNARVLNVHPNTKVGTTDGRDILVDIHLPNGDAPAPLVVFAHGFKGFKDWGTWAAIGEAFVEAGYAFVRFNFSHNGTTPDDPSSFGDLHAFGENNYSRELHDLDTLVSWLQQPGHTPDHILTDDLTLIGHSRGGATVLLFAERDARVSRLITWAAVSRADYAWHKPGFVEEWALAGVYYVRNGRTGQDMPLHYQFYQDFEQRRIAYDTERASKALDKPWLIVHGTKDPAVSDGAAKQLHEWQPTAQLHLIEGGDHVFGGQHPFEGDALPEHTRELVEVSLRFLATDF